MAPDVALPVALQGPYVPKQDVGAVSRQLSFPPALLPAPPAWMPPRPLSPVVCLPGIPLPSPSAGSLELRTRGPTRCPPPCPLHTGARRMLLTPSADGPARRTVAVRRSPARERTRSPFACGEAPPQIAPNSSPPMHGGAPPQEPPREHDEHDAVARLVEAARPRRHLSTERLDDHQLPALADVGLPPPERDHPPQRPDVSEVTARQCDTLILADSMSRDPQQTWGCESQDWLALPSAATPGLSTEYEQSIVTESRCKASADVLSGERLAGARDRCFPHVAVFRREVTAVELAQIEALLGPCEQDKLTELARTEFEWALSSGGALPRATRCLDSSSALTVLRQLSYLNGLPALDGDAAKWFLEAHGGGDGREKGTVNLDELREAYTHLLRMALRLGQRHTAASFVAEPGSRGFQFDM